MENQQNQGAGHGGTANLENSKRGVIAAIFIPVLILWIRGVRSSSRFVSRHLIGLPQRELDTQ